MVDSWAPWKAARLVDLMARWQGLTMVALSVGKLVFYWVENWAYKWAERLVGLMGCPTAVQ